MPEIRIYYREIEHREMTVELPDDTELADIDGIVENLDLDFSGASSMQRSVDIEFWEIQTP